MKRNIWRFWGLIWTLMAITTTGCEIINPAEDIPAYIYIENFELATSPGEGTASRKITEAFVFVGGDFLGAYSLPTSFPVLKSGSQKVDLFPGIKDNGIDATPEIYTFYTAYDTTIDLQPEETDTIRPSIEYVEELKFTIVEDFENTLQLFREDIDGNEETTIELTDAAGEVFEGQKSAKIVVSKDNPTFAVASIRFNELPPPNREVYLELNYRTEVPFDLGLYYTYDANDLQADFQHSVNVKESWNKIYINMTDQFTGLNNLTEFQDFQIGIKAIMANENNEFLEGSREIFLDNIKLIHY